MFVDVAKVSLKAGKGGDGAVSFRHEIYIPKGGPDGGDGGKGGDIVFKADKDTDTLIDFRFNPILAAENGRNGSGQRSSGRSGADLIVEVPVGTSVYKNEELIADLTRHGEEAVIAKGGDGGFGNAHFKSSVRQTPRIAEVGEPGEEFEAVLELKLLADVGLVGLPNAGKSTFLSVVSNARPEIADYPFTTLTPQLGVATVDGHDLLIADIPGLIEGAAEGKGLGHAFLRHVERTAVLLHLVDVYSDDAGLAYQTIRRELQKYGDLADNDSTGGAVNTKKLADDIAAISGLAARPEIVALTKCEGVDEEIINMQTKSILVVNPEAKVFPISSQAHMGVEELLRCVRKEIEKYRSRIEPEEASIEAVPTISLDQKLLKDTWNIEKKDDIYVVTGEKIEKFARRTDLNNYASVNRLRDIMKKMGVKAELTTLGAEPSSIISIAGKEFTLVEDY